MVISVESTMVQKFSYSKNDQDLFVTFNKGGVYRYKNVPMDVVMGMIDLDNKSVGSYFHSHIRTKYEYSRVN
jgi:hypothetical protein